MTKDLVEDIDISGIELSLKSMRPTLRDVHDMLVWGSIARSFAEKNKATEGTKQAVTPNLQDMEETHPVLGQLKFMFDRDRELFIKEFSLLRYIITLSFITYENKLTLFDLDYYISMNYGDEILIRIKEETSKHGEV